MQMNQSASMRMEQRQLLTPRMIQSMEILQLPLTALEERIEQELEQNPVLELKQQRDEFRDGENGQPDSEYERNSSLTIDQDSAGAADFERLNRIGDYLENEEFSTNNRSSFRLNGSAGGDGERDRKLDAMANTAARGGTLAEHLLNQWSLVEMDDDVRIAGEVIINHIEPDGYLRTPLEQIQRESPRPITMQQLRDALSLVQTLEPAGVGASNLQECLLLQLDAMADDDEMAEGHDFPLERALIEHHLKDLEQNRYPQISRKLERDIDDIKAAVRRMSRLNPHPGKLIAADESPPVTPDATITYDPDTDRYEIEMSHDPSGDLYVRNLYRKMLKERSTDRKTKEFLNNNVRNAKWLIEAIEQRASTLKRVIRVVVDTQRDFFDHGPEHLKPLPMIGVADQLGIHVATVSRAVSEKWIQTPIGIYPLRRFFSGGTTDASGNEMSWDAVKEKLRKIVDDEDKQNPLNDDELVDRLKEQGIDLARRTVAKYRKLLNIPTARQRKAY